MKNLGSRLFITLVILGVIGITITGLVLSGSPMQERLRRFDDQRVQDLQQLQTAISQFWTQTHRLPKNIAELQTTPSIYLNNVRDPKTQASYELILNVPQNYQLCATFETDGSRTNQPMPQTYPYPAGPILTQHGIGRTCFPFTVPSDTTPPAPPKY